jgi:hypothetical protein
MQVLENWIRPIRPMSPGASSGWLCPPIKLCSYNDNNDNNDNSNRSSSPYTPGCIGALGYVLSSGLCWPLSRPHTPLATPAQAALAHHQTADQEESADTTFMVM